MELLWKKLWDLSWPFLGSEILSVKARQKESQRVEAWELQKSFQQFLFNVIKLLLTVSAQDDDVDGYDTMVVKEDDNDSVVSYSLF